MDIVTEVSNVRSFAKAESATEYQIELTSQQKSLIVGKNRKEMMASVSENAWLWICGGGTYFDGRRIIVIHRGLDAPSNPGRWTIATGFSNSPEDWSNPMGLLREIKEEIVNNFVEPQPLELANMDKIIISHKGQTQNFRGYIHFDEDTRLVNFMLPVFIQEELGKQTAIRDGEVSTDGKTLNRDMGIFDLSSGKLYSLASGEWISAGFEFTPQADYFIKRLKMGASL